MLLGRLVSCQEVLDFIVSKFKGDRALFAQFHMVQVSPQLSLQN
jgi:hypothetical protein